jgi:hypothetical protein
MSQLFTLARADIPKYTLQSHGAEDFECGVPPEFLEQLKAELGPRDEYMAKRMKALLAAAGPWPIKKECSTEYTARHHSGARDNDIVKWICLHCTQSNTAEAAARWFESQSSAGSAHVCSDPDECFRTLLPKMIPWAAPGANTKGWHLEIAGYAHWTRAKWLAQPQKRGLDRAAYKAAIHSKFYGIPNKLLTVASLKAQRLSGFTTHARCTLAFGGSHTDPGEGFPLDWFMNRVRFHAATM